MTLDNSTNPPTEIKTVRYTTDPEEILGEFQSQFAAIYSKQAEVDGSEESIIDFLKSDGDEEPLHALHQRKQCITPDEFTWMEGLMSETELTETLTKFMKGASAPGVDGFTVNWLREFWPDLRKLVTNALNEMYGEELLSSMCREAIIHLLRKDDKNPLLPGNYRPISLLSIFYKLASATITRRIKPVLSRLVEVEQKAYLSENNSHNKHH